MAGTRRKAAIKTDEPCTYADLLTKPEDELWELVDGVPYAMTVPSADHQYISVQLTRHFANFFDGKPCQIFHAPYGVFLPKKGESIEETTNLVIPDLVVVCDEKKRTSRGCRGAPDLVVEILSPMTPRRVECRGCGTKPRSPRPSSGSRDQLLKLNL